MTLKLKHIYIPEVNHEFVVTEEDLKDLDSFCAAITRSGLDVNAIVKDSMNNGREQALEQMKSEKGS